MSALALSSSACSSLGLLRRRCARSASSLRPDARSHVAKIHVFTLPGHGSKEALALLLSHVSQTDNDDLHHGITDVYLSQILHAYFGNLRLVLPKIPS